MKKIKIISLATVVMFFWQFSYGQAIDASTVFEKQNRNTQMIGVNLPEKITNEALDQRMANSGLKEKSKNGVTKYKGVVLSEISPDKIDIYTKVEEGPNNTSTVHMAVSRGYDNFILKPSDSLIIAKVKSFLEAFIAYAENYSKDKGISKQQTDLSKDEKAYQSLLAEQTDLQKRKEGIDLRLLEIQSELDTKYNSLNKKKSDLEDSKTKRWNNKGR